MCLMKNVDRTGNTGRVGGKWVFDTPKFLILNLAIGGIYPHKTNGVKAPYFGLPEDTAARIRQDGASIQIDWVRVTQPVNLVPA